MKFTLALATLVAAVMADNAGTTTITSTVVATSTISACPSTVTDCPIESTQVVYATLQVNTTYCPEEATATPSTTTPSTTPAPVVKAASNSTCSNGYQDTCTVTVTAKRNNGYAANNTIPLATGTGTPVTPTQAYYSNAANAVTGGVAAIGGGILAALLL